MLVDRTQGHRTLYNAILCHHLTKDLTLKILIYYRHMPLHYQMKMKIISRTQRATMKSNLTQFSSSSILPSCTTILPVTAATASLQELNNHTTPVLLKLFWSRPHYLKNESMMVAELGASGHPRLCRAYELKMNPISQSQLSLNLLPTASAVSRYIRQVASR